MSTDTGAVASMSPSSGIVWIASYLKSGNTWVRAFLHNLMRLHHWEGGEQDINAMSRFSTWDLDKKRYAELLGFEPDNAAHRNEIAATRHAVHQQIADAAQGLVFIKTHNALVLDRGHSTINFAVTAGAVYVIRNPLDVAISYTHHSGISIDSAIARMAVADAETPGSDTTVYEVQGCRPRMPEVFVPTHVVTLDALPINARGKIDRPRLKSMYAGAAA